MLSVFGYAFNVTRVIESKVYYKCFCSVAVPRKKIRDGIIDITSHVSMTIMTLDKLKEICDLTGVSPQEQNVIVDLLNQQRFEFGVKELPEIKPLISCGWISRSIKPISERQSAENSWEHYKTKIRQWIVQIEKYEASLTKYDRIKRFVGKHKWILGLLPLIISLTTHGQKIVEWIIHKT